ncbi:MAG TPA: 3-deoxy-manno-octulosonate cytidylyltransferase [Terriglobales bacterium]|nr:3-deoxy-manno-octulosonate cytidylyltransferase [Terriglobales bacterium]
MQVTANIIGVIPARMGATRLPGKPLRPIAGIPMIQRVYEGAAACSGLRQVLVATESPEIVAYCESRRIPVRMTSPDHASGTDRVWQVVEELGADAAVNIQGDEPMVRGEMIAALVTALFRSPEIEVASLFTPVEAGEAQPPSACKVVVDAAGWALYFSRAPIPYPREGQPRYRKHLGYYAYSRAALQRFHAWPPAELELAERLEQLRFLDHGVRIAMAETPFNTVGIDTPEDLAAVEKLLS